MAVEIYYFSGTGNSLAVARDIAKELDGKILPMAARTNQPTIKTDAVVIGIVFPVHNVVNGGVPSIVRNFIARLEIQSNAYIFAVCTCGAGSGDALPIIRKLIEARGGKLAAGFTVRMPFNCSPFTKSEEQAKRFKEWNHRLTDLSAAIKAQKKVKIKTVNPVIKALVYPLGLIMHNSILKNYRKLAEAPKADFDTAVSLVDNSYLANKKCDGCGICAKVCPAANIEIIDNRPVWLHHCESCLACMVWCPRNAIGGGILSGKSERYHHPEIKLRDFVR